MQKAPELKTLLSALRKNVGLAAKALTPNANGEREQCDFSEKERAALTLMVLLGGLQKLELDKQDRLLGEQASIFEKLSALHNITCLALPIDVRNALPFPGHLDETSLLKAKALLCRDQDPFIVLDESVLGYIYQFFSQPLRKVSLARVQSANKSSSLTEVINFTQLYTPDWVVRHLIEETFPGVENFEHVRILDPSCGAGHFLVQAYDHLLIQARKSNVPPHAAASSILKENLFGCDIDAIALWVTGLALVVRTLNAIGDSHPEIPELNLSLLTEPGESVVLGSLANKFPPCHFLNEKFDVVIGNPPYLGRKLLDRRLKEQLKLLYPDAHQDLCTAFIAKGLSLLKPGGRLGFITQSSVLYLPTYTKFRNSLLNENRILSVVEAGTQVFPLQTGEKINSVLLVIEKQQSDDSHKIRHADLRDAECKQDALATAMSAPLKRFQHEFKTHRGAAINFRCPQSFIKLCRHARPLSELADIRQGLATSDNDRFLRSWRDVPEEEIGQRWIPYIKGSGSERWFAPIETVVDWGDDGNEIKKAVALAYPYLNGKIAWVVKNEQYYKREGLTFSFVNSRQFAVRYMQPGCIFDVAGSALFPFEENDRSFLLAYLNSSFMNTAAMLLNPTINFQVGDLKQLPVVNFSVEERRSLAAAADECVEIKRFITALKNPGLGQQAPAELRSAIEQNQSERITKAIDERMRQLLARELEIDALVLAAVRRSIDFSDAEFSELAQLCQKSRQPKVTAEV